MRLERHRSRARSGWSFETTGAVDRALAIILVGILLLLSHALGIELEILRYLWARP